MIGIVLTPLLCFNSSTEQVRVNVSFRVMMGASLHLTAGRHRKEKTFQTGHGRIAFYEHGGKSGMAMIKYPLYKKNNSRKNTLLYPGRQIL